MRSCVARVGACWDENWDRAEGRGSETEARSEADCQAQAVNRAGREDGCRWIDGEAECDRTVCEQQVQRRVINTEVCV